MEKKLQIATNGQQIVTGDLNLVGETAALADDRVFAELFRLKPMVGSTVSRAIVPNCAANRTLVNPNGASGSVSVQPFRAMIGSRSLVASGGLDNLRNVRSTVAVGANTLAQSVAFANNGSGSARIDIVYAAVTIDANAGTTSRRVKDPSTGMVTTTNINQYQQTTVTLGVITGTPSASPAVPSGIADAGSVFYIPLALVRIPDGFNATSTVSHKDIIIYAPVIVPSAGGNSISLPNKLNVPGSPTMSAAALVKWANGSWTGVSAGTGTQPPAYLPTTAVGGETLMFYYQYDATNPSHEGVASGVIIDDRDWRGRVVRWNAYVFNPAGFGQGAALGLTNSATYQAHDGYNGTSGSSTTSLRSRHGIGHTMSDIATTSGSVMRLDLDGTGAGTEFIRLDIDPDGQLILTHPTPSSSALIYIYLEFTGVLRAY